MVRKYADFHRINNQGIEEKQCKECLEWYEMNKNNFGVVRKNKDSFNMLCKKCQRKNNQELYQKDREKRLERSKKRQQEKWEEVYKGQREWCEANPDRVKKKLLKYRTEKKEEKQTYQLDYQRKYPDKMKSYRINKKHKTHKISKKEWIDCKNYFGNKCAYCGLPIEDHWITYKGVKKLGDFHKEHKDDEGSNDLSNCIPSCESCNSKKWEFGFDEWYNPKNPVYSQECYDKIIQWITEDYKSYIKMH